ncbi:shikimate kinase [Halobacillus karajensis]|uniref:Shikimate kinase n=1 Tax=Halobacillus karajensis TaxID=195088 RepID=A0A024P5K4_9BACI|nr:shikimate kinase [Halobacillus karajensis]CDQ17923.1 Shikimate kinase [Halobacillus karajensis]CDQ24329.1 Shikimate kinase [Halobacillus karajensis]CDQ29422.1 Shikimate kinase [Halobacillus karajensis]SEH61576.1 shikimate kinase [Halobacillus karajensis]
MIYLIGFMGSGKTTVANELSKKIHLPYIEMDESIEKNCGMSIKEMFKTHGETFFRDKETEFLKSLTNKAIVSTGGGVVLREENREYLKNGLSIYLKAEWKTIVERLTSDTDRPLWKGDEKEKKQRFEDRLKLYREAANEVVSVDWKTPEEIADEIWARLK